MSRQRDARTGLPLLAAIPKIPKLKEPDELPRPIVAENLANILAKAPAHVAEAVRLCTLMGFRLREVLTLTVKHVDFENRGVWLRGEETKGKRGEFIPANHEALQLLRQLVKQAKERKVATLIAYKQGEKGKWRSIKSLRRAWRRTLKACGLEGQHRFHNTKATFVTAVAMNAPAAVTQKLARHKNFETTQRYILVADKASRDAVDAIDFSVKAEKVIWSRPIESPQGELEKTVISANYLKNLVGMAGFEPTTPSPPD